MQPLSLASPTLDSPGIFSVGVAAFHREKEVLRSYVDTSLKNGNKSPLRAVSPTDVLSGPTSPGSSVRPSAAPHRFAAPSHRMPGRARSTFSDPSSDNEEDLERLRERPRRFSYVMDRELFEEATDEFRKVIEEREEREEELDLALKLQLQTLQKIEKRLLPSDDFLIEVEPGNVSWLLDLVTDFAQELEDECLVEEEERRKRMERLGDDAEGAARREPGSAVGGTGASGQAGQVEGSYSEWCKSFERRKKSPPLEQLAALKTICEHCLMFHASHNPASRHLVHLVKKHHLKNLASRVIFLTAQKHKFKIDLAANGTLESLIEVMDAEALSGLVMRLNRERAMLEEGKRKLTNDITKDRDKINEVKRIWHSHKSRQQRCRKMHPYSGKSTNPHQRAEHRPAGAFSPALSGDGDSGFSSPGQGGGRLSGAAAVGGVAAAHYSSNTNTSSNFAAPPSRPPSWASGIGSSSPSINRFYTAPLSPDLTSSFPHSPLTISPTLSPSNSRQSSLADLDSKFPSQLSPYQEEQRRKQMLALQKRAVAELQLANEDFGDNRSSAPRVSTEAMQDDEMVDSITGPINQLSLLNRPFQ